MINLPIDPKRFEQSVAGQFEASPTTADAAAVGLREAIERLRRDRYDDPAWNFRH
jgi:hypothetical protein